MINEVAARPLSSRALADVLDDGVVVELAAGDVDRDVEGVAAGVPGGHLLAGVAQHPPADFSDLAGLFEDRDELVGLNEPPGGVVPTQQCFDADEGEVVEVVDRLVDETELVAFERGSQIELELDAVRDLGLHLRMEDLVAVLARGLGLVERHVRIAQQVTRVRPVAHGDTDTGVDDQRHRRAVELERLAHHVQQPFRDQFRRDLERAAVDQHHELVATHPADRVRVPQRALQPAATATNNRSPASWPSVSFTFLKSSRSTNNAAPVVPWRRFRANKLLDPVHDQRPVRQAGQRVVQRLMAQLARSLVHQAQRPRPARAQHEEQRAQKDAQDHPGDQQPQGIPVGEHAADGDDRGRRRQSTVDKSTVALDAPGGVSVRLEHGFRTRRRENITYPVLA